MAIRLIDRYPNRANPANTDYPHGSGRNKSSPTAIDGTPFDENRFNDQEGFFQSLLEAAKVTPNNTPDTVPDSQYANALSIVANGLIVIDVAGSANATLDYNQARVHGFRLTGILTGNIEVIVPDTERMYTVVNDTTGDFTVTVKTALGTGVVATQGQTFVVRCDGVDVVRGYDSQRTIYVGSAAESFAGLSPVAGVLYRAIAWHQKSGAYAFADPTTRGGGLFVYDAARLKSDHDGVTVFSPTVPVVSAQAGASLQIRTENYGTGAGETDPTGAGVLVRLSEKDHLSFHDAGVLESFTDCTARANAAILAAVNGPGKLYADEGTYGFTGAGNSADGMKLPSGAATQALEFYGAGIGKTIIHQDASARFVFSCNTSPTESGPNPDTDNSRNIKIHDMTFEAEVATAGFSEQFHLLSMNAVSGMEVYRTAFIGFRGDALYLGSSQTLDVERHNQRVSIHHCIFDGVNNDNRNAISIIDGETVDIYRNKFIRCTRADMPGPIDIEPDNATTPIIKNINVRGNEFDACGGGGIFQVFIPLGLDYTETPQNIQFKHNWIKPNCLLVPSISNSGASWVNVDLRSATPKLITEADPVNNIDISENFVYANGSLSVKGAKGVQVHKNRLVGSSVAVLGSYTENNQRNSIGISYKDNFHRGVGNSVGAVIIGMASKADVLDNRFTQPTNEQAIAIFGDAGVTGVVSDDVTIDGNVYAEGYTTEILNQNNAATNVYIGSERTESGDLISISSSLTFTNLAALQLVKSYNTSRLPDSFPIGESISAVNGDTGAPDANDQGVLKTTKPNADTGFRKFVQQWYYPANNSATTLAEVYWRKGEDASNSWSGWIKVTGTAV